MSHLKKALLAIRRFFVEIPAPGNLTANTNSGGTGIVLNWIDNSSGELQETQFVVERSLNDGAWTEYATVSANTTTYTDTSISFNNKYSYRIRARQGSYLSSPSNISRSTIVYTYYYDGTGDYTLFPHNSAISFDRTSSFSIAFWFKHTALATTKRLISKYDSVNNRGFEATITTGQRLRILFANNGTNKIDISTGQNASISGAFLPDKWFHVVITYNGNGLASGFKLYVDGRQYTGPMIITTDALGANTTLNTSNLIIGADAALSAFSLHYQAMTRIFNRELTSTEIRNTLYNKGLPNYAPALSGMVLDSQVNSDIFSGSSFVVQDSSTTANNGSTTGLTSGQKLLVSDLDAIKAADIQPFVSPSFLYDTYDNAGYENEGELMNSPFTDRRSNIVYDPSTNRTYVAWMKRGYLGWNRETMVFFVDHTNKYCSISYGCGYWTAGTVDGHPKGSIIVTPDEEILEVNEDVHVSPLYISKTSGGKDLSTMAFVTSILATNKGAYPIIGKIGTSLFIYSRGSELSDDEISVSTNNGLTWTSKVVLNLNNDTGSDRAYFQQVYDPSKIRILITMREDSIQTFTTVFYIESSDLGATWTNYLNTFSASSMVRSVMEANFKILYQDDKDIHVKCNSLTPSGKVVFLCNDVVNNYKFVYYNGSSWVTKPVVLPLYDTPNIGGNNSRIDYWGMYSYSDTHFVIFRIEKRSGFDVVVKYVTTNAFNSWTSEVVSPANKNHEQLQMTHNQRDASVVVVAATQREITNEGNIFIYEYELETAIPEDTSTPIAPTLSVDDALNTINASHALGVSELEVNINNTGWVNYTAAPGYSSGSINVGNVSRPVGYYQFRTKLASGRPSGGIVNSPAFTAVAVGTVVENNDLGWTNSGTWLEVTSTSLYRFTGSGSTSSVLNSSKAITINARRVRLFAPKIVGGGNLRMKITRVSDSVVVYERDFYGRVTTTPIKSGYPDDATPQLVANLPTTENYLVELIAAFTGTVAVDSIEYDTLTDIMAERPTLVENTSAEWVNTGTWGSVTSTTFYRYTGTGSNNTVLGNKRAITLNGISRVKLFAPKFSGAGTLTMKITRISDSVEVYNQDFVQNGATVKSGGADTFTPQLDTGTLTTGNYLVELINKNGGTVAYDAIEYE